MKKLLLLAAALLFMVTSKATHIIGGEITVKWISDNNFQVNLRYYRDCKAGNAAMETSLQVGVYNKATNANVQCFTLPRISRTTLSIGDACYKPNLCVEEGIFQATITLPDNKAGYYLSTNNCCRNSAIVNIVNPLDAGATWYVEVPDPALHNSSPVFGGYPSGYMCVNNINVQDFSATDADGDSLVYSLVAPFDSHNNIFVTCPDAGPYPSVTFKAPYSAANMIGGTPAMSINPTSGILTANPSTQGIFVFTVRVEEYRRSDKMKLGEIRRDIQYGILPCTVAAAFPDTTICSGNPVQLQATGGSIFRWSPKAGLNDSTIANPIATVFTTTTYTVSVQSTAGGCASTATVTIHVNSGQNVAITTGGPTEFCEGGSVTLTGVGAADWQWSTGETTQSIVAAASGTYSVIGSNSGCSGIASQVVTAYPKPVVSLAADGPRVFCLGGSVNLTANGALSYLWNNGETSNSIHVTSSMSYTAVGTDANGCTAVSNLMSVIVNTPPTINIQPDGPTSFCQGNAVQLCASGAKSYTWNGSIVGSCILASTTGKYTVVGKGLNECSSSQSIDVTVKPNPVVTVVADGPLSFCPGETVKLTASGADTYVWTPGGETTTEITVNESNMYVATGTSDGCSSSSNEVVVTINPAITVTITPDGPTEFCEGGSVNLCATEGASYIWSNGETTQCISVANPDNYEVTVTNEGGCFGTSSQQTVIHALPTVVATPDGPTQFCDGGSVNIVASGATTYEWNNGQLQGAINVVAAGSFYAIGTDDNGCKGTSNTVDVSLSPQVEVTLAAIPTLCVGSPAVALVGSPAGGIYSGTGVVGNTFDPAVSGIGTFDITYTYDDGSACLANTQAQRVASVSEEPTVTISISPTIGCVNHTIYYGYGPQTVILTATADMPVTSYQWYIDGTAIQGATSQTYETSVGGSYNVQAINGSCVSDMSNTEPMEVNVVDIRCGQNMDKVVFCHVPPGNHNNPQTLCLASQAVPAHMGNHPEDCLGPCGPNTQHKRLAETGTFGLTAHAYPNPFTTLSVIEFELLDESAHTVVELYTLTGERVATLFDKQAEAGVTYQAMVDGSKFSAGVYMYKVTGGEQTTIGKLVLVK